MEGAPRAWLRKGLRVLLLAALPAALLVWALPGLVARLISPDGPTLAHEAIHPEEADAFVDDLLAGLGASSVEERAITEAGEQRSGTSLLPAGQSIETAATLLRSLAHSGGVEAYGTISGGLDLDIRVYAGPILRWRLLLMPALVEEPSLPPPPSRRERPLVSLIVTDLGDRPTPELFARPVPLTVAIIAWSPFGLPLAQSAAEASFEILVQPPQVPAGTGGSPEDAIAAIPYASGILWRGDGGAGLPPIPMGTLVVPGGLAGSRAPEGMRLLATLSTAQLGIEASLRRLRHLAAEQGQAALSISVDDPGLPAALAWARQAESSGYRLVLAHEAARPEDTRGRPDQAPPDP